MHCFTINGEKLTTPNEKETAAELLRIASEAGVIPGKPEQYSLRGAKSGRTYKSDDTVDLATDNDLLAVSIGPVHVGYPFTLNDDPLSSEKQFAKPIEILTIARNYGVLPKEPSEYELRSSDNEKFEPDKEIDLTKHNAFMSVPTSNTTVLSGARTR